MTHAISTLSVLLIAAGLVALKRGQIRSHAWLMTTAFVVDVCLVLYIEVHKGALAQADQAARQLQGLLLFHVVISVAAMGLHLMQLVLGWRMLAGKPSPRWLHRWGGVMFCVFRLGNYVTSFMVSSG